MQKLGSRYYQNPDVLFLANDLLGKVLWTQIDGECSSGLIVETEAYAGVIDKASHAYGNRRTRRTEIIYHEGGVAYVYLCYGIHSLFNIVTSVADEPHAVLIRAIEPRHGKPLMEARRHMPSGKTSISAGPGAMTKALGIDLTFNGKDLTGEEVWIEDIGIRYTKDDIAAVPRIGVAYAEDHALLPWRFFVKGNKYVSKPNR